jgi:hypothetical protein
MVAALPLWGGPRSLLGGCPPGKGRKYPETSPAPASDGTPGCFRFADVPVSQPAFQAASFATTAGAMTRWAGVTPSM